MSTVSPTSSTTAATSSTSGNAMQQLSGNFDTFLQLLTTQLQNQDPTSPMDTNQFTQQLVEYSQVEQQIDTNTNLTTLISQGTSQSAAYATSYLGKTVTVSGGQGALTDGEASWNYNLGAAAASTVLSVTNSSGQTVYNGAGATAQGNNSFNWNGEDNNGNQLPDGTYTLNVAASDSSGNAITSTVTSSGQVSEINMTSGTPELTVGSMQVGLSGISSVTN
ncbi:MAG TPA: flagellar hook assembly protein FlgD [Rhizomicrobium sp.]|jgi:flagellar basal-body rod modification protein FlgD|nr:flagellar hook assembly protein FlgD [Rhizomicrobium sp.]